jgi:hypothetical protein
MRVPISKILPENLIYGEGKCQQNEKTVEGARFETLPQISFQSILTN